MTLGDIVHGLDVRSGQDDTIQLCRNTILCAVQLMANHFDDLFPAADTLSRSADQGHSDDDPVRLSGTLIGNRQQNGCLGTTESELVRICIERGNLSAVDIAILNGKGRSPKRCVENLRASVSKIRKKLASYGCELAGGEDGVYGPFVTKNGKPTDLELAATRVKAANKAWRDGRLSPKSAMAAIEEILSLDSGCHAAYALRLEVFLKAGHTVPEILDAARPVRQRCETVSSRIGRLYGLPPEEWQTSKEMIRQRLLAYAQQYADLLSLDIMTEMRFEHHSLEHVSEIEFKEMYAALIRHRRSAEASSESCRQKIAEFPVVQRAIGTVARVAYRKVKNRGASMAYEDVAGIAGQVVYRHVVEGLAIQRKTDLEHVYRSTVKNCWPKAYVAALADYLSETEDTIRRLLEKWRFTQAHRHSDGTHASAQDIQSAINATDEEMGRIIRAEAKLSGYEDPIERWPDFNADERKEEGLLSVAGETPPQLTDQNKDALKACLRRAGAEGQGLVDRWIRKNGALLYHGKLPSSSDILCQMPDIEGVDADLLSRLLREIYEIAGIEDLVDA